MADLTPPRLIPKKPLARSCALRRDSTEAEKRLWSILRDRKLDGWKFRRQVAIESFIVDFCCIEARVIVEIDGAQHADARKHYDDERTRELRTRRSKVLRFWNSEVLQGVDEVAEEIGRMLVIPGTLTNLSREIMGEASGKKGAKHRDEMAGGI